MAIIPLQNVTADFVTGTDATNGNTLVIFWGPMNGGDEGEPISVYAFDDPSWQFTGAPEGGQLSNPNVPVSPDRTVTLLGSNDGHCWGKVFTLPADPAGMAARTGDPLRVGYPDGKYISIKPVVGGAVNLVAPDCGLLLFCAKSYGSRS